MKKQIKENFKSEEIEIKNLWQRARENKKIKILEYFKQRIFYLQHERHIHLLVTLFFGGASIFLTPFTIDTLNTGLLFIFIAILFCTLFYIIHYYNLENTCQRWQKLALQMQKELNLKSK